MESPGVAEAAALLADFRFIDPSFCGMAFVPFWGSKLDIYRITGTGKYLGTVVVTEAGPKTAVCEFKPARNVPLDKLLPEEQFPGFTPPRQTIAPSIGHHREWLAAIRTGGTTTCNFAYSGTLAETVLLGNVAYRSGKAFAMQRHSMS